MGMIREVKEPKLNRLQNMHIDEAVDLGAGQSDDGDVWPHDGARGREIREGLEDRMVEVLKVVWVE